MRLFGERMLPVASPALVRRGGTPLATARPTSRATCCCISTIPTAACRGSTGRRGSPSNGQPGLKPAGSLRFKLYDQVIQAARRRAGRRARPHSAHRRASARRPPRRAVPQALRLGARLLRGRRAARDGPRRRRRVRRLAAPTRRRAQSHADRGAGAGAAPARASAAPCAGEPGHDARRRIRTRGARAVAVDRALRAPRRPRARACSTSPAATAATRASSPRAARACSRSIATRRRSRRSPAIAGIETRAVDLEARRVAARRRALRRDRRRQLPAPAAVPAPARRARRRRRAALRDVRARQRGLRPAGESGFPAASRASCCSSRARRPDGGRVRAGPRVAAPGAAPSCSGSRPSGPARPWPPRAAASRWPPA